MTSTEREGLVAMLCLTGMLLLERSRVALESLRENGRDVLDLRMQLGTIERAGVLMKSLGEEPLKVADSCTRLGKQISDFVEEARKVCDGLD